MAKIYVLLIINFGKIKICRFNMESSSYDRSMFDLQLNFWQKLWLIASMPNIHQLWKFIIKNSKEQIVRYVCKFTNIQGQFLLKLISYNIIRKICTHTIPQAVPENECMHTLCISVMTNTCKSICVF